MVMPLRRAFLPRVSFTGCGMIIFPEKCVYSKVEESHPRYGAGVPYTSVARQQKAEAVM